MLLAAVSLSASAFLVAPLPGSTTRRVSSTALISMKFSDSRLEGAFKKFDRDSNGVLDESELKSALAAAGQPADDET